MYTEETTAIQLLIDDYFNGIFQGDIQKLRFTFHPQCLLFGDINGQPYFKNVDEYLEGVKNRKNPYEHGENFSMEILSI